MLAHIKRTIRSRGLCVLGYFSYWLHWSTNRITVHWNTSIQSSATPSVCEMHRCVLFVCVCVECAFIERFLWFLVHFLFHVSKPWFSRSHPNYWYRRLVCNLSVRMCLCVWDFCMFDFCFNQAFVCFNRVPFLVCKLLFDGQRISFRCFIKFFFSVFFFLLSLCFIVVVFFVLWSLLLLLLHYHDDDVFPLWFIHAHIEAFCLSLSLRFLFFCVYEEFLRELRSLLLPASLLLLHFIVYFLLLFFEMHMSVFC